jgi:adenine-specific DNA-methyltransferase
MVQLPEDLDENLRLISGDSQNIKNAIELCESLNVEHNIAEVAKERIRRAGNLIKEEFNLTNEIDIGFRVLKLDTSNMVDTFYNPSKINKEVIMSTIDNIKEDRSQLDLLFQVMLNHSILLSSSIIEKNILGKKYYDVANKKLIACFEHDLSNEVITELSKLKPEICIFRDYSFATDAVAINAEQIFKTYSPSTDLKVI